MLAHLLAMGLPRLGRAVSRNLNTVGARIPNMFGIWTVDSIQFIVPTDQKQNKKICGQPRPFYINEKKYIFCINRPRLVTIFSVQISKKIWQLTQTILNKQKNLMRKTTQASRNFFRSDRPFEIGTFDYRLLKRSVLGWRSVFRVRFSEFGFRALTVSIYFTLSISSLIWPSNLTRATIY